MRINTLFLHGGREVSQLMAFGVAASLMVKVLGGIRQGQAGIWMRKNILNISDRSRRSERVESQRGQEAFVGWEFPIHLS